MTGEQWHQIEELFYRLASRPVSEHGALLTGRDPGIRKEVENLLANDGLTSMGIASAIRQAAADVAVRLNFSSASASGPVLREPEPVYELAPGKTLSHYRIEGLIGTGGMGVVYKARDFRLDRLVALKFLKAEPAVNSPEDKQRFITEAKAASALDHPNIGFIYEIDETPAGTLFIAMAYYEGFPLSQLLQSGPLAPVRALDIGIQIGLGLAAAHARGIVHRDIKPSNIIVLHDGTVKIIDFGVAKIADLDQTTTGTAIGTPAYMAPEQIHGIAADHRCDLWAAAVVLYEMAAGRLPFSANSIAGQLHAILKLQPDPLSLMGAVYNNLNHLLLRALTKDPQQRYQSARDFVDAASQVRREIAEASTGNTSGYIGDPPAASVKVLRTSNHGLKNFPALLSPMIGRERETAAIMGMFRQEHFRLVVLTGPGGVGKTRLGVEVAVTLSGQFEHGAYFVDLSGLRDPATFALTLIRALGLRNSAPSSLFDEVAGSLNGFEALVFLDNFEQILAAAPVLLDFLACAPGLVFLVSSREPLKVRGEREFAVTPLPCPDVQARSSLEMLRRSACIALFSERAKSARMDFELTAENVAAVAEICSRCDGLPLAVELAAARVKVFSPRALLARMDKRLPLLSAGSRDLPERQKTLKNTIAWSYDLLEPAESELFARLSVFVGGFSVEVAERISKAGVPITEPTVDLIDSLVRKSLIYRYSNSQEEPRFTLLETIREFAEEQLNGRPYSDDVRCEYACLFLALAEEAEPQIARRDSGWLDTLELEHPNLRAAIEWLLNRHEIERASKLVAALWRFWEARGYVAEGMAYLSRLIPELRLSRDIQLRIKILYAGGVLAEAAGEFETSHRFFSETLEHQRAANDLFGIAASLNNLGIIAIREQRYEKARECYSEALSNLRELKDAPRIAQLLSNMGNAAAFCGDFEEAERFYNDSLEAFKKLEDGAGVAWSWRHLGDLAKERGMPDVATERYRKSLDLFQRLSIMSGVAGVRLELGRIACGRADHVAARAQYEEAMALFADHEDLHGIARVIEAYATLACKTGNGAQPVALWAAASRVREKATAKYLLNEDRNRNAELLGLRASLGIQAFNKAWAAGLSMSVQTAIDYALAVPS